MYIHRIVTGYISLKHLVYTGARGVWSLDLLFYYTLPCIYTAVEPPNNNMHVVDYKFGCSVISLLNLCREVVLIQNNVFRYNII